MEKSVIARMFKSNQRWCSFNIDFPSSILQFFIHLKINAICFINKDNSIHLKENVNLIIIAEKIHWPNEHSTNTLYSSVKVQISR